jgi:hypothetical protein
MFARISTLIFVLALVAGTLWGQQDPLMGTWKLNLSKSKYDPGPPPQSQINKYEPSGANAVKRIIDNVSATGEKGHTEANYVIDGKEYPVPDSQTGDRVVNRRIDANTTERIITRGGMLVNFAQRTLSADRRTLTVTQISADAQGKLARSIAVYDKQ